MSTDLSHAAAPGGTATAATTQQPEKKGPPYRALAVLFGLILLALGLMALPRPTLYYPYVTAEAGGMQVEFLLNGRRDKTACEAAAGAIADTFTTGCHECRTRSQSCIKHLPSELRQRFDDTPLEVPSARLANGIVTYSTAQAGNTQLALMACRESERQAAQTNEQTKVACYPAGAARPHTPFEKQQDQTGHTNFTLLLGIVGALIAGLTAAILITYYRHRQTVPSLRASCFEGRNCTRTMNRAPSLRAAVSRERSVAGSNPWLQKAGSPRPCGARDDEGSWKAEGEAIHGASVLIPTHPWLAKLTLAGVDTLVLLSTFLALVWPEADDINRWSHLDRATVISYGVVTVLTIGWFWLLLEHYVRRRPFWDELQDIVRVLITMFMVSGTAAFVAGLDASSSQLIVWSLNFVLIPLGRSGVRHLLDDLGLWQHPTVIIGTGENAREAYLAIKSERGMGYRVLGFINVARQPPPSSHGDSLQSLRAQGAAIQPAPSLRAEGAAIHSTPSLRAGGEAIHGFEDLDRHAPAGLAMTEMSSSRGDSLLSLRGGEAPEAIHIGAETFPIFDGSEFLEVLLSDLGKPQVILALDSLTNPENQTLIQRLLAAHTKIHIIPSIRGLPLFGTQLSHFFSHEVLFLTVRNNLSRRGYKWIKRVFDIVGSSVLLIILFPLMAYVAWRIWREDGGPVIFHQPRLGQAGGEFGFLKFRSMVKDADNVLAKWRETNSPEWQEYYANNFKLKNDPRVLGVGAWIRASSIDELPQLINVLRGQMSLVGPRPLLARELPEYGGSINYYRQARPGITGLWQISGRSQTKFNDRVMLDEWYVQNWSLWYDIAILFKTLNVVLHRDGAC